tara:strand:- start:797 stop:931 length:135 start_codon:yes stop_codon:yes gene_type:complete
LLDNFWWWLPKNDGIAFVGFELNGKFIARNIPKAVTSDMHAHFS